MELNLIPQRKSTFFFEDLIAWQKGHKLLIIIFKNLKANEQTIDAQFDALMKQSAMSICNEVAAAYEQNSARSTIEYLLKAKASVASIITQIILAKELQYFAQDLIDELYALAKEVSKIIQGLINYINSKN